MLKFIKYRKDIKRLKRVYDNIVSLEMELGYGSAGKDDAKLLSLLDNYKDEYELLRERLVSIFFLV